jgi:hypothetical protein
VSAQAGHKTTVGGNIDQLVVMNNPKLAFELSVLNTQLFEFVVVVHSQHRWKPSIQQRADRRRPHVRRIERRGPTTAWDCFRNGLGRPRIRSQFKPEVLSTKRCSGGNALVEHAVDAPQQNWSFSRSSLRAAQWSTPRTTFAVSGEERDARHEQAHGRTGINQCRQER